MARLITKGNLAIFEYPHGAKEPSFDFDMNGVLFVFGYDFAFAGKIIGGWQLSNCTTANFRRME